ncbi:MAG: pseudaminic acid cytidylyltransferase [Syntrophales bacterium]|nr:pseudaminic acid cytidylyltransferase [Syntrophales bacterium]
MRLAVIPARGGSKRILHKNIKEFCGKPIIAWSIESALKSRCFDRIIVSTDDAEIADIARQWGAEVPFRRPDQLSDDYIGTAAVIRHAIEWFAEQDVLFEQVCCIYATAPFVTAEDIRWGLEMLISSGADSAISVTSFPYPIQRAVRITKDGFLEMLQPEHCSTRSQDLEEAYHDAGQFYWGISDACRKERITFPKKIIPVIVPRYRVQDIDTQEDWVCAELLFKVLQKTQLGGNR